jgi:hypothetical protein
MNSDYIKSFYEIKNSPSIASVLMIKNEENTIEKTLKSILGKVDCIIIYDTGSTDNTINIVKSFSDTHKINLYLRQGEFKDFATSRNNCLDFADTFNVDYLILLDANDELKCDNLRKICKENLQKDINAFLICQKWFSDKLTKYFNIRLIKSRKNWRYIGVVHEYIKDISEKNNNILKLDESIFIYQNRNEDGNKSFQRFSRDRELLLEDIKNDPKNSRSMFYLAQTCDCLGLKEESLKYSKLRLELGGFNEEIFHSLMRCAKYSEILGMDWNISLEYYLKAYNDFNRAEPLVRIAEYYKDKKMWKLSFMFAKNSCDLDFPYNHVLFVDEGVYKYLRWHILSIVAYYAQEYDIGKGACLKALENSYQIQLDKNNLKFYLDKDQEKKLYQNNLTKKEFLNTTIERLKKENPKATINELNKKAMILWKSR